jgi:hypothetical protein
VLVWVGLPFTIVQPEELRQEIDTLGSELVRYAAG